MAKQVNEALDHPLIDLKKEIVSVSANPVEATRLAALVPGYTLMFLFFLLSNLAVTVVEERSQGSLRRLLVTPAGKGTILAGKMLPFFFIAVAQMVFVLLVSSWVFDMPLGHSPAALAMMIVATLSECRDPGDYGRRAGQDRKPGRRDHHPGRAGDGGHQRLHVEIHHPVGAELCHAPLLGAHGPTNVIQRGLGVEGVWQPALVLLVMSIVFFVVGVRRFKFE